MIKKTIYLLLTFLLSACYANKEQILFSSSRNGDSDIFMMDTDGKNQIALTKTNFEEWSPTWIRENEISFLRQEGDSIFRIKLNLKTE